MRLNIGCGDFKADGWVNVDRHPSVEPDVLADVVEGLPFTDGSAELVYAGHVLEHLWLDDVPIALKEISRVLAADGTLMVVGPDSVRARDGGWPPEVLDGILHGKGRWPGDEHRWDSHEAVTVQLLRDAGWTAEPLNVAEVPPPWPVTSRIGWQFAIRATR